jgi:hypothetical protein
MFQYLCYYQRELALWMWHNLDTRAADICLDTELAPAFKVCVSNTPQAVGSCVRCQCVERQQWREGIACDDRTRALQTSASTLNWHLPSRYVFEHLVCGCVVSGRRGAFFKRVGVVSLGQSSNSGGK